MTRLAESMAKIGLQSPITVRVDRDDLLLVAGLHRLQAALRLGWDKIDAIYLDGDATDARLWEIAENLHRADLSAVERNEHVAEWVKLTEVKVVSGQIAQKLPGRPEGGINAAARKLGVEPGVGPVLPACRCYAWCHARPRTLHASAPVLAAAVPRPLPLRAGGGVRRA